MSEAGNTCKNVMTIQQVGPTCWFNALLMGLFYSQGMRNVMFTLLKDWKSSSNLVNIFYNTIKDLLLTKYTKSKNIDLKKFRAMYPEHILGVLNSINSKKFYYDPGQDNGAWPEVYITHLFELFKLHKDTVYLDLEENNHSLIAREAAFMGRKLHRVERHPKGMRWHFDPKYTRKKTPTIPKVIVFSTKLSMSMSKPITFSEPHRIHYGSINHNIITYSGVEYIIDSAFLTNFNILECTYGHAIAGVTCNNKRFVYNGWTINTQDPSMTKTHNTQHQTHNTTTYEPSPCELMEYDWLLDHSTYCINTNLCRLNQATPSKHKTNVCFNFHKGTRIYFAIRKDIFMQKHTIPHAQENKNVTITNVIENVESCPPSYQRHKVTMDCVKCPPYTKLDPTFNKCIHPGDYVLNPLSVQKFLKKTQDPKTKAQKPRKTKTCPEGKVLNEKGNCVNDKSKPCPKDKIRNPKTGNCIKKKTCPKHKKLDAQGKCITITCPKDKELNLKTGKCIKTIKCPKGKLLNEKRRCVTDPKAKCPDGKVRNPATNRCVKAENLNPKKALKGKPRI